MSLLLHGYRLRIVCSLILQSHLHHLFLAFLFLSTVELWSVQVSIIITHNVIYTWQDVRSAFSHRSHSLCRYIYVREGGGWRHKLQHWLTNRAIFPSLVPSVLPLAAVVCVHYAALLHVVFWPRKGPVAPRAAVISQCPGALFFLKVSLAYHARPEQQGTFHSCWLLRCIFLILLLPTQLVYLISFTFCCLPSPQPVYVIWLYSTCFDWCTIWLLFLLTAFGTVSGCPIPWQPLLTLTTLGLSDQGITCVKVHISLWGLRVKNLYSTPLSSPRPNLLVYQ